MAHAPLVVCWNQNGSCLVCELLSNNSLRTRDLISFTTDLQIVNYYPAIHLLQLFYFCIKILRIGRLVVSKQCRPRSEPERKKQSDWGLHCLPFFLHLKLWTLLYEPRHEKTYLWCFRPGETQTGLLSFRS